MKKLRKKYARESFFFSSKSVSVLFSQKDIKTRYNSVQFFHYVKRPVSQPHAATKVVKLIFFAC